ncbi:MAG: BatB protein [Cryomorphaceae bacterium BACL29 MAG-121220-bin8]|jgi:Ca-activated chloride channel homolog|nr:MAG: BatB protein [Cryomorphaceae bacterium BACL29 MAG-121220-bin8]|tara:strand:+ start:47126 stop:48157 length:1032 start_codon:yes stop_codon:yes gene_type:complete
MYQLEETTYFYLTLVIPIILMGFLILKRWKSIVQKKYISKELLETLSPDISLFKPKVKLLFLTLFFLFTSIGLVNPKIGTQLKTVKREGVDIVFAIDVSKSMLAEDVAPNRLEKAKRLVSQIINQLNSDRVGVIAYAATALPILPITNDYSTAKMFLESLNTEMLSSQGTAILESITLAKDYYDDENQTNRVLCILSDGEDHELENQNISEIVEATGITIFTIGIGTLKGAPIPMKINNIVQSYKKDFEGEVVITKLIPELLEELANSSSGIYIEGTNTEEVVDTIIEELKKMDKQEFESKQFIAYKDQFQWFIAIALIFLCLELFIFDKKTYWIKKLNLFNE